MQGWFSIYRSISVIWHINKLKNKNHVINSVDEGKAFDKTQHPVIKKKKKKTLNRVSIKGIMPLNCGAGEDS